MRALIIDPSLAMQSVLNQHLLDLGSETVLCSSGEDAVAAINEQAPDIVCLAMHLNDMSGIELALRIRATPNCLYIPLIMLTTEENKENLSEALRAGVTEIFRKDDINTIANYLIHAVESKKQEAQPSKIIYISQKNKETLQHYQLLKKYGYQVTCQSDVKMAIHDIGEETVDLIITDVDLNMDECNLSVVRKIKSHVKGSVATPILTLLNEDDSDQRIELLRGGVSDCQTKPMIPEELCARAANLIKTKRQLDQLKAQQIRLQQMAMTDQLTGLCNRHYLMEAAPKKISEAKRHSIPISLLVVDLDKFKNINDTHGHATGDIVLSETGLLLNECCRDEDLVVRFGGEEFVILLSHCDLESGIQKAESIRKKLEALRPNGLTVTGSIGISAMEAGVDLLFKDLFIAADKAVYEAKDTGRNKVVAHSAVS
ncbi:hypothetical protein A9Q81_27025 [Gammaproteobacteria bacterium 42_54_T18]|nr:hypothetical protein A9Q81_27025 [Gammaproteobacteria bacterium 42_54_T18]